MPTENVKVGEFIEDGCVFNVYQPKTHLQPKDLNDLHENLSKILYDY